MLILCYLPVVCDPKRTESTTSAAYVHVVLERVGRRGDFSAPLLVSTGFLISGCGWELLAISRDAKTNNTTMLTLNFKFITGHLTRRHTNPGLL
jgi:hypothetical protein